MTANPLKSVPSEGKAEHLLACEFAALARENGRFDLAKLWDRLATELGEERIPNGITVRYNANGTKRHVAFRA